MRYKPERALTQLNVTFKKSNCAPGKLREGQGNGSFDMIPLRSPRTRNR